MPNTSVDLRSDTVTQPTPAMREAMMAAELGDDVLGDDPTVLALQDRMAALLGKEAATFVPSGTLANLLAIRSQTQPGDEIIGEATSHFFRYEAGGFAAAAGCSTTLIPGERGLITEAQVTAALRPDDIHFPVSRLLSLENTHNTGGGTVWPLERLAAVTAHARELGLRCHLYGARLFNACVQSGHQPGDYARHFDTVSLCFSKGLGAPVGSILAGSEETLARARRFRKMFGGAMRQSGLLAAAALYALDHHVDRLAEDHALAQRLARAIAATEGLSVDPATVQTNIVYFDVDPGYCTASAFCGALQAQGVRMLALGPARVRAVTHLDVDAAGVERAIQVIEAVMKAVPT
ncbi:MAG: threonine aldolase family protein [Phycisphaerales bacterium JB038]